MQVSITTWTEKGYNNWKKEKCGIAKHEKCATHKECCQSKLFYDQGQGAEKLLSEKTIKKMKENRIALRSIFESLLFLGRQGLAIRGHTDERSNFCGLLELLGKHNSIVRAWLNPDHAGYSWISHNIGNKMVKLMANNVLQSQVEKIKRAKYFSVIADETTDISTVEQLSLCTRCP